MLRLSFILFLTFLVKDAVGQPSNAYQFKYLKNGESMQGLFANCVFKDKTGVLWIGSNEGIKYYDGIRLQEFGFSDGKPTAHSGVTVGSLVEDPDGRLWAGTDTGLIIISADRSSLIKPSSLGIPDSVARASNSQVQSDSAGFLYLLAGMCIYHFDVRQRRLSNEINLEQYKKTTRGIRLFAYIPSERTCYIMSGISNKIFRYRGGILQNVDYTVQERGSAKPGLALHLYYQTFWAPLDTSYLVIQIPNLKGSAYVLHLDDSQKRAFYAPSDAVEGVFPVVSALQSYCQSAESPVEPNLRSSLLVLKLFYGKDNCWYIATSAGVFIARKIDRFFQPVPWTKGYSTRGIASASDGMLVVGAYGGLLYGNPRDTTCRGLTIPPPWSFFQKGTRKWDIFNETHYSAYHLDLTRPAQPQLSRFPLKTELVFHHSAVDAGSGYWSAQFNDTLWFIYPETGLVNKYAVPSAKSNSFRKGEVKALVILKNKLWVASTGGLQAYELNKEKELVVRELTTFIPDPLKNLRLNCLYKDREDKIWIGSATEGLFAYDPESHALQQWTPADGLAHINIYSIIGSHGDSVLWIGTEHGLSRMDIRKNSFCNYHTPDGLLHNEFNSSSAFRSPEGVIFMGGPNGVVFFRPEDVPVRPDHSPGFLVVEIQNSRLQRHQRLFPLQGSTLTLESDDDFISLTFRLSDFYKDHDVTFRYRLLGLQEDWLYVDIEHQAIFTNLRPGEFTLEVQTQSNTGNWVTIYTLQIRALPAWHQTWWFKLLVGSVLAFGLQWVHFNRLKQLRKTYELRKQVSDDLHDDLGSRVFALKALASKLAGPELKNKARKQASEQFETLSKEVLGRVREFIWVSNPENDLLIRFLDRFDDYIRTTIRPLVRSVEFTYDVKDHLNFTSSSRHHLMMVLQELLINMSKHTQDPIIQIHAKEANSTLHIRITNQHSGALPIHTIDRETYGRASMEKRLSQYDIHLDWHENESSQTAVLSVKINSHV